MSETVAYRLLSATRVIHWRNAPVMAVLALGAVAMVLPFLWMVAASFRPPGEAYTLPPSIVPDRLDFSSYQHVFESGVPFIRMYVNSLVVATVTTAGVLLSCAMAAFAFARLRFAGRELLFPMMLVGLMVPPSLVLIPIYFGLATTHLLDTIWALVLTGMVSSLGIYMMRQFMVGQSRELEEAALMDGAGYWTIFLRISLPQLGPPMATLGIITFTASWNNFLTPFVLIKTWTSMTLPVGILALQGVAGEGSLSVVMAATTMAILPLFLVFLVAQRFIVEGITMSGLKG